VGGTVRVVFDTNIYISAFITPGGRGESAFLAAVDGRFRLFTSVPILTETARKLTGKFRWDREHMTEAVQHIATVAEVVKPGHRLALLADDPDNRILECARAARANFVVTGDKHLLRLERFGAARIVTLADFLQLLADE
jgi:putative PIN family toxin of toxin-antitoxin system